MKEALNDFELEIVSGGGNATFSQKQVEQDPSGFFKATGVSLEEAKKQCPSGSVQVDYTNKNFSLDAFSKKKLTHAVTVK